MKFNALKSRAFWKRLILVVVIIPVLLVTTLLLYIQANQALYTPGVLIYSDAKGQAYSTPKSVDIVSAAGLQFRKGTLAHSSKRFCYC